VTAAGPPGWAAPLHELGLDRAGVGAGTRLLDLGCGAGEFAAAAARRGAVVTGIDADPGAIAAAAAAVPTGDFTVADAHDPPRGPFDVAAAVQLLMHVRNPVAVLDRAARVGGTVLVTVWGEESECDLRAFGEALAPWLPPRPTPSGPPLITRPTRLRHLVELAGLRTATFEEVDCPFDYPDDDALAGPVLASGIGAVAARAAGPRAVREAVLERCAEYRTPDGGYRRINRFRVLTAHRRPDPH
jgi:SAM-dependent methyltransferase